MSDNEEIDWKRTNKINKLWYKLSVKLNECEPLFKELIKAIEDKNVR